MMISRLTYIDYAKGFALTVICLSHILQATASPTQLSKVVDVLMYLTVPLFFYVSGMLFKPEKHTSFYLYFKHKTKTLFVPYIALSLLFVILCPYIYKPDYLVNNLDYPRHDYLTTLFSIKISAIIEWIISDLVCIIIGISSRSTMPLWFVFILYFVSISFYWANSRLNRWAMGTALTAMIIAFALPRNPILSYLHIHAFFMAFFFYALGFYSKNILNSSSLVKACGVVGALLIYILFRFHGTNGFVNGLFGDSPIRFILHVCAGIYLSLCLFEQIDRLKYEWLKQIMTPFLYISRNALPIIAVHFWAMLVYVVFLSKYIMKDYQFYIDLVFVSLTVVLLVPLLNKYVLWTQKNIWKE